MTTAATISARLILDKSDYDKGVDDADKKATSFADKMKSVGSSMTRVGGIMTASVTAPIVAGFGAMIKSASDLNESTNAMNVVYGEAGDSISKFGETSAETIGLAKSDWFQLAAVQGAALKNYGMSNQQAADETMKLGTRAADMASIFNTDVDSAMTAIGALMRGESEPIKRYGVSISEAAVEARLMEMGLSDLEGQELMSAKAQARLALFYEQTDQFAGDFANTTDQLANGTRVLQAQLKDEAAAIGLQLLPYVLKAVKWFGELLDKFKGLSPATQKIILGVLLFAAVIGPVLVGVGSLVTAIGTIIPVVTAIAGFISTTLIPAIAGLSATIGLPLLPIIALIAVIVLLYLAWKNNWGGIQDKLKESVGVWKSNWNQLKQITSQVWNIVTSTISNKAKEIWKNITGFFAGVGNQWRIGWAKFRNTVDAVWNRIVKALSNTAKMIAKTVVDFLKPFISFGSKLLTLVKLLFMLVLLLILTALNKILNMFGTSLSEVLSVVKQKFADIKTAIASKLTEIYTNIVAKWNEIKTAITNALVAILTAIVAKWNEIKTAISNKLSEILAAIIAKWNEIKSAITNKLAEILTAVISKWLEIYNAIKNKLTEIITAVVTWGLNLKTKIGEAIQKALDWVKEKIAGFIDIGKNIIDNIIQGLNNNFQGLVDWLSNLINDLIAGLFSGNSGFSIGVNGTMSMQSMSPSMSGFGQAPRGGQAGNQTTTTHYYQPQITILTGLDDPNDVIRSFT